MQQRYLSPYSLSARLNLPVSSVGSLYARLKELCEILGEDSIVLQGTADTDGEGKRGTAV
jgi:hypothetical protein